VPRARASSQVGGVTSPLGSRVTGAVPLPRVAQEALGASRPRPSASITSGIVTAALA
jgi:hypothetical protein